MKKTITIIILLTAILTLLMAQEIEPFQGNSDKQDSLRSKETSIIDSRYTKKSAGKAMLLSSVFPGAGQLYVTPRSITGYVFPVIEAVLLSGYFIYQTKGTDKEDEYMAYATDEEITIGAYTGPRYDREIQHTTEASMIAAYKAVTGDVGNIYTNDHFRLDDDNTQHFYEDIGKYNKYIFGWADWQHEYGANGYSWAWSDTSVTHSPVVWVGNKQTIAGAPDTVFQPFSEMRKEYIEMRMDAEEFYKTADNFALGLVFNHIVSSIDALRVTRKYNREYIVQSPYKTGIRTAMINGRLTPLVSMSYRF